MRLTLTMLMLFALFCQPATGQRSEVETGRTYYTRGEFKKAAAHFRLAIEANPNNAEAYYWIGMSYQRLADIALPFGARYGARARVCLTKAMELAPSRPDYRLELFEYLLDPGAGSRTTLRQAADMLRATSQSDPNYTYMRKRLEGEYRASSLTEARLGKLILAIPQAIHRIAELPAAALSSRPQTQPANETTMLEARW